jgi:hypothetical protein
MEEGKLNMALSTICNKGHSYIQADSYVAFPKDAPHCPECFIEWEKEQEEKDNIFMEIKIEKCARCGTNHSKVYFTRFINPMVITETISYNYWGVCPVTQEPIICKIEFQNEDV